MAKIKASDPNNRIIFISLTGTREALKRNESWIDTRIMDICAQIDFNGFDNVKVYIFFIAEL